LNLLLSEVLGGLKGLLRGELVPGSIGGFQCARLRKDSRWGRRVV
jgi:hypothetical protein